MLQVTVAGADLVQLQFRDRKHWAYRLHWCQWCKLRGGYAIADLEPADFKLQASGRGPPLAIHHSAGNPLADTAASS